MNRGRLPAHRCSRYFPHEVDGRRGEIYIFRAVTTISTDEARDLIDDGIPFIDVRSVEEFEEGHVPGAVNIPLNLSAPGGLAANPNFVKVVEANFEKDAKVIVACKAGGRSARAVAALKGAGYTALLDMTAGWMGKRDAFGELTPGWSMEGREVEKGAEEEQTYAFRKAKAGV